FAPSSTPVAADGRYRPTGYMEKVSEQLEAAGKVLSKNQVEKAVSGKAEHVRRALDLLIAEGYVREVPNAVQGRYPGFESIKPYREADDPDAKRSGEEDPF